MKISLGRNRPAVGSGALNCCLRRWFIYDELPFSLHPGLQPACPDDKPGCGSAWGPVIPPVFKTGARHLRGVVGVFDSHTLPPFSIT